MRLPAAQVVLPLVLMVAGAAVWLQPWKSKPPSSAGALRAVAPVPAASLMPDSSGRIELVVCSVNSARRAALRNADLISGIVNALPPHVRFILLTNDPDAFVIEQGSAASPERTTVVRLPADKGITIWPQDPFLVLRDARAGSGAGGGGRLLASREFARADDGILAGHVSRQTGMPCEVSSLDFEGGNIVADEVSAFIGINTIAQNAAALGLDARAVAQRFEAELGLRVVVIGPAPQPVGHIDMALTPLGNGRLLLADTASGARIAEQLLAAAAPELEKFERTCEQLFFGDASIPELHTLDGRVIRPPSIVGQTARVIEHSRSVAPALDALAAELVQLGYNVHRIPLLLPPVEFRDADDDADGAGAADADRQPRATAGYPTLSYNNVLMETSLAGQRTVYLPRYGLPALDDAAATVWRRLGWDVRPVEGFAVSAMYGGSLRCCVKVLSRSVPDASR